ncbi:MAG: bifunctional UDP-N-acetylglucosamine diphosphorylase/glucosamine-1-phosphate N-acetyltransferase GlmU [Gammaproteobacteria bacterium]
MSTIILAAGQGTRMRSGFPKVLHPVAGRCLLEHVVAAALRLEGRAIHVVYGHGGQAVPERLAALPVHWVEQAEQLGTGHAVAQALPAVPPEDTVLVLYGDVPLITAGTLERLVGEAGNSRLALLTVELPDPTGYGRIVRGPGGGVLRIVEEKDANVQERALREGNTGILAGPAGMLARWLAALDKNNAQGEFYLTDVVAMAVADGVDVPTVAPASIAEVMGVNDRIQLAERERDYRLREAQRLMRDGVTLRDPERFDLRGEVRAGRDVVIDVNVVLEGVVHLGDRVRIGPNSVIRNTRIGDDTEILSHTLIEDAVIGPGCRVGPFARVRPGTDLAAGVHVGNFVELKNAQVADGSKINHLSYIGDTTVGRRVNIGAGTITCNYDGANKHRTVIEDEVFIGSDTQLVAPVTVGGGATIGAGTTVTRDAPPGELTVSRVPQQTRPGWKRPVKKPKA